MLALLIYVLFSSAIVFTFKYFGQFRIPTFQALVVNYLTCTLVGWLMSGSPSLAPLKTGGAWLVAAVVLGALFIATFYLVALTTQRVSVSAAAVATKMSLVIPVAFNLVVLRQAQRPYTALNYVGMVLAVVAIILTVWKPVPAPAGSRGAQAARSAWLLPVLAFLASGSGDTLLNYASSRLLPMPAHQALFPILLFGTAAVVGLFVLAGRLFAHVETMQWRSLPAGIVLGILNFYSVYFLIRALGAFGNDGAFVYPLANIGTILLGALGGYVLFRERLGRTGQLGLMAALVALLLLSYQEVLAAAGA
ncbi:hypothetical protein PK28_08885 [Hymenobacter sp. DG25B]|uniref:DMT family transporter n=1 Tax=Hymenobacter sp. DG25B TaxID=1385664 RepID=UPI000540FFF3|nr:DMT family transporter [Hymenobacter sp. DG25B]AIZ65122.1 hypothetical protein PK28_08885 [Hymenobacter sp. DG25B]